MDTLKFTITNNAWINNGLARLIHEIEDNFEDKVLIERSNNSIELISNTEKDICYYINEVIKILATNGTYNYNKAFKLINMHLNGSYSPPYDYPRNMEDLKKKIKIPKEYRDQLKQFDKRSISSSEQVWKMRLSFLNKDDPKKKYLQLGLDFKNSEIYESLENIVDEGDICPSCGNPSNKFIKSKQFFNPFLNEHHNNKKEGIGDLRKNMEICPKCATLAIISLFDKFIPFYKKDVVLLALPNVYDLNILEKIVNNLSLDSQFINFSHENQTFYSTNILNFNNVSKYSSLLNLLNNILNNYSKEEVVDLFQTFESSELIDLVDWIFITKESFRINRIKANENIFKILKPNKDPTNGKDIYLVNDFFNKILFGSLSQYKIDKFFKSFLDLNHEFISVNLFQFLKDDVKFYKDNTYPIYLFKEVFLEQIMGVILMLNDDFKKSCRNIASTIGQAFYKDIGLLSKFAYATDEVSFKEYIEESFFLMAKKSALDKDVEFYSNISDLDVFFEGLTSENFKETKSYFVSFMSSSAIHKKWKDNNENKKNKESEGGN